MFLSPKISIPVLLSTLLVLTTSAYNQNSIKPNIDNSYDSTKNTRRNSVVKCVSDSQILENDNATRTLVSEADFVFIGRIKSPLRRFNSEGDGVLEFPVEVKVMR